MSIKIARSLKNPPKVSPRVHGYVSFLIGFCSCLMNDLHVTSQFAELKAMLLKNFKRSPPGLQAWRPRSNFYSERACAASSSTRLCLSVTATEHRECSSNCYLPQSFANMSSGNAKIGQPAPDFSATAVVDGQFKDLKLSDYKGKGAFVCSCGKRRLPPHLSSLLFTCPAQESMLSSSSTRWTSHLCVPPRSWPSATGSRTSVKSTARSLAAPLTPTSPIWHGEKETQFFY